MRGFCFTPTSNLVVFQVKKFTFFVDGVRGHNLVVSEHRSQLKIAIVLSVYCPVLITL